MKLINKIVLLYLIITLAVFAAGGVITFRVIKRQIDLEQRRHLRGQLTQIRNALARGVPVENLNQDRIQITKLETDGPEKPVIFSDTLVMHPWLKRLEPYKRIQASIKVEDQLYAISMFDLMVETDDITESVSKAMIKTYLLLSLVVVVISFVFSSRLFRPFNQTLQRIREFDLQDPEPIELNSTSTKEFMRLNEFLKQMTSKSRQDYKNLKEFSENASHEIQTPLAIAKGKLEILMQSPNLTDQDVALVQSAQQSITKLSKLSHSLSLLTKIENQEFSNKQEVNLSQMAEKLVQNFSELLEFRKISLSKQIDQGVIIHVDPVLADILLSNLLQNAIKHNIEEGKLIVTISNGKLSVANSGDPLQVPVDQLFERFKKNNQSAESLGLGLAIVKRICLVNNFDIRYDYRDNTHNVQILFGGTTRT